MQCKEERAPQTKAYQDIRRVRSTSSDAAVRKAGVRYLHAGVAQSIERFLAKEEVQGLSPCTRTNLELQIEKRSRLGAFLCWVGFSICCIG